MALSLQLIRYHFFQLLHYKTSNFVCLPIFILSQIYHNFSIILCDVFYFIYNFPILVLEILIKLTQISTEWDVKIYSS